MSDPRPSREARQFIRRRVRGGDIVLFIFIGAAALLFVNYRPREILEILYHPVAGLILIIMIVEFMWLKSGDRTRVYRLEIERLRKQRRRDEDLLRRAGEELLGLQPKASQDEKERIQEITKQLRDRI